MYAYSYFLYGPYKISLIFRGAKNFERDNTLSLKLFYMFEYMMDNLELIKGEQGRTQL